MNNSAMLRAFQILRSKPALLLLLLPIQATAVLSSAFIPDMSSLMNIDAIRDSSVYMTFPAKILIDVLVNSLLSLVSLAGLFVLIPPAMELLSDGAAGRETAPRWYTRGLKKHWWKPIVSSLIMNCIIGVIAIIAYFVLFFAMIIIIVSIAGMSSFGFESASGLPNGALLAIIVIGIAAGGVIALLMTFIQAFFGLFLPALTDRGFGEAFKLIFNKQGIRKLPRLFGGYLLIAAVSSLIVCTIGAVYVLLTGVPQGPTGPLQAIFGFMRSAPGIIAMLLASVIGMLQYPFQFSVYQMVKDEE